MHYIWLCSRFTLSSVLLDHSWWALGTTHGARDQTSLGWASCKASALLLHYHSGPSTMYSYLKKWGVHSLGQALGFGGESYLSHIRIYRSGLTPSSALRGHYW